MENKVKLGNRMVLGVIFDMDGLMFDTERIYIRAEEMTGAEFGIDIHALPDLMGVSEHEGEGIYKKCFGEHFDYGKYRARKVEILGEDIETNGLQKKPGLDEILAFLREQGIPIALATASDRTLAGDYLKRADVAEYFQAVVCGDMVEKGKPDPEIFLKAAELLGTKPEETLVLEDSYNGIRAAHRGGFIGCMVPDTQEPTKEMQKIAFRVFESLFDVVRCMEES